MDLYQVGAVTQTHGIRGEVKVFPMTDDVSRFMHMKGLILDTGKEQLTLEVTNARPQKNLVILKFKGYDNINDVERFKGAKLFVKKEDRIPLSENEYFIADLIGISVVTDEGRTLGVLTDVMTTGANDVYVVENEDGREVLLPAISECILSVEEGCMTVHLLPGLLDEE